MSVPPFHIFMRPLLTVISDGNEVKTTNIEEKVSDIVGLSPLDKEELIPSGMNTYLHRIHWAKTYLVKAGCIEATKRGFIKITPLGKDIWLQNVEISLATLKNIQHFAEWYARKTPQFVENSIQQENNESPEERISKVYEELNAQLKADILENLYNVSPVAFEHIIIDLLIAMGYGGGKLEMAKALGRTGDGGVDGVIKEDELGLDVVYIQAKKYKLDSTISRPDIQSFVGSLEGFNASKGVFVTTGKFAHTVHEYAKRVSKRIVLISGEELAGMMLRHNVGVRIKESYQIKYLDEDYFIR